MSHDEKDDPALLEEFRSTRSETAFTAIVRRHLPLVFHSARRRLGSPALAEEAAQSAFTRLAAKIATVSRHPERLRAWLCRTAYLEACEIARKEKRLSRVPVALENPLESMHRPELYDHLEDALNALPELDRELILRHCCAGEEYQHIAQAVGKSPAACQKRVERALERLGKGLGGARTAGVALAAFAAFTTKSPAMPSAQKIASAALSQSSTAGTLLGSITGLQAAAYSVILLAGGTAGWSRSQEPPLESPAAITATTRSSPGHNSRNPRAVPGTPLSARPIPVARPLQEVLETIQAGRIGPLIEFLPTATIADLRAIIAEDDFSGLGEGSGSHGIAHSLAMQRWTEIDPPSAFDYALRRDHENTGGSLNRSAAVIARWKAADYPAAITAYRQLPPHHRRSLAESMVQTDPDLAAELAAMDPEVKWVVATQQLHYPQHTPTPQPTPTQKTLEEDRRALESLIAEDKRSSEAFFRRMAGRDPGHLKSEVPRIRDPETRAMALLALLPDEPPSASAATIHQPWLMLDDAIKSGKAPNEVLLGFLGEQDAQRALAMLPKVAAACGDATLAEMTKQVLTGWLKSDVAASVRWAAGAGIHLYWSDFEGTTGDLAAIAELFAEPSGKTRPDAVGLVITHLLAEPSNPELLTLAKQLPENGRTQIFTHLAKHLFAANSREESEKFAAMTTPEVRQNEILPRNGLHLLSENPGNFRTWLESLSPTDRGPALSELRNLLGKENHIYDAERLLKRLEEINP